MTFKFAVIVPATGPNKLARFRKWAEETVPGVEFSLPPQVPIKATALTVRVKTAEDRDRIRNALPRSLP